MARVSSYAGQSLWFSGARSVAERVGWNRVLAGSSLYCRLRLNVTSPYFLFIVNVVDLLDTRWMRLSKAAPVLWL